MSCFNKCVCFCLSVCCVLHFSILPALAVPLYVDINSPSPTSPYSSWATAATELQNALSIATPSQQVWIAEGVYLPGGNRTSTFLLDVDGISVFGGLTSGMGSLDERDWVAHRTVLSGDILSNDVGFSNNSENCYHVMTITSNASLNGLIFVSGNADGTNDNNEVGGGIYIKDAGYPTTRIDNCVFSNNACARTGTEGEGGGAIYTWFCSSTLSNCTFNMNDADGANASGGGMYIYGGQTDLMACNFTSNTCGGTGGALSIDVNASANIYDSSFVGNSARAAGAIDVSVAQVLIDGCEFIQNQAVNLYGGAVYFWSCSGTNRLLNCLFDGNEAVGRGGALGGGRSTVDLLNCTLVGNHAQDDGGAVYAHFDNTTILLANCILWSNKSDMAWDAFYGTDADCATTFDSCLVEGGAGEMVATNGATLSYAGPLLTTDPLFVDYTAQDFHLRGDSPCLDTGTNIPVVLPTLDMDGQPRFFGVAVDMGMDEASIVASGISVSNVNIITTWDTVVGSLCEIQWADDLVASNWYSPYAPFYVGTSELQLTDTNGIDTIKFYRLFWNQE